MYSVVKEIVSVWFSMFIVVNGRWLIFNVGEFFCFVFVSVNYSLFICVWVLSLSGESYRCV